MDLRIERRLETERWSESYRYIKVREYPMDNQKWTIQRNWQHLTHKIQHRYKQNKKHNTICVGHHYAQDKDKQLKHNTKCVGHHYMQTNTNNVNKTWALLQTTGYDFRVEYLIIDCYHHDSRRSRRYFYLLGYMYKVVVKTLSQPHQQPVWL